MIFTGFCEVVLRLMIGLKSVYVDTIYIVFKVSLRKLIDYP